MSAFKLSAAGAKTVITYLELIVDAVCFLLQDLNWSADFTIKKFFILSAPIQITALGGVPGVQRHYVLLRTWIA